MTAPTIILHTAPVEQLTQALALARARQWQPCIIVTTQPERLRGCLPADVTVHAGAPEALTAARVILLYNEASGFGYRDWRRRARQLADECWTLIPDGTLAPLTAARCAAEDQREQAEELGRRFTQRAAPLLVAAVWRCWQALARGARPDPTAARTLLALCRGRLPVIRFVRLLHVLQAVTAAGGQAVTDIGTGDGMLLQLLRAQGGRRLLGIDRAFPPALTRLATGDGTLTLQAADLETWTPASGSSCLVASEVLEHLHDDRQALQRWAGALAPGGTLIVHTPYRHEPLFPGDVPPADHVRPGYTPDELTAALTACGLQVQQVRWTLATDASRLGWLDRRLERHPLLQHCARPLLLALAAADLFAPPACGHGVLAVARKPG
ncbi:MAG TPA: class I SAM-dependent methyltransferase, partial [bacterium]|nr:class I SAM-dependent methyltransferase [bacterium]